MKRWAAFLVGTTCLFSAIFSFSPATHAEVPSSALTSFSALAGVLGLSRSDPGFRLSSLEVDVEVRLPQKLLIVNFSADMELCDITLRDIESWLFCPAEVVTEATVGGVPVEVRRGTPIPWAAGTGSVSLLLSQAATHLKQGSKTRLVIKVAQSIPTDWEFGKYGYVVDLELPLSEMSALCPQGTAWTLRVTVPQGWSAIAQGEPVTARSSGGGGTTTLSWRETVSWMGGSFVIVVGPYRRIGLDLPGDCGLWVLDQDAALVDDLVRGVTDIVRRTNEVMSGEMGMPELKKLEVVKATVPGETAGGKGPAGLVVVEWGRNRSFRQDLFLQLLSHELLHQWFPGQADLDLTTGMWLSEGMATYFDARYVRNEWPPRSFPYGRYEPSSYSISAVTAGFAKFSSTVKIQQVYIKGAWVIHMLRKMVGDEAFRGALQRFYRPGATGLKGTLEFREIVEEESGMDLDHFFHAWLDSAANPKVVLENIDVRRVPEGWQVKGTVTNLSPMPLPPVTVTVVQEGKYVASATVALPYEPGQAPQLADFAVTAPSLFSKLVLDPEWDILNVAKSGRSTFLLFVWAKRPAVIPLLVLALSAFCAVIVRACFKRRRPRSPAGDRATAPTNRLDDSLGPGGNGW